MRVAENGELTINADVVAKAGLKPGMKVVFSIDGRTIHVHPELPPPYPGRGAELIAYLARHAGRGGMTTDEIMAMTRGED